jgi:hypothetical protein
MEDRYNIDEILLAVNEINNKKKEKKINFLKSNTIVKDYSAVPRDTLKMIEEAEKIIKKNI